MMSQALESRSRIQTPAHQGLENAVRSPPSRRASDTVRRPSSVLAQQPTPYPTGDEHHKSWSAEELADTSPACVDAVEMHACGYMTARGAVRTLSELSSPNPTVLNVNGPATGTTT